MSASSEEKKEEWADNVAGYFFLPSLPSTHRWMAPMAPMTVTYRTLVRFFFTFVS
jgi:hypothetical protein